MRKSICIITLSAVCFGAAFAGQGMLANGIALQSNAGTMTVKCNNIPGNINITSSSTGWEWQNFSQKFNNGTRLNCIFYAGSQQAVSATINMTSAYNSGLVNRVQTYNGYPQPTISPGVNNWYPGIKMIFNPKS